MAKKKKQDGEPQGETFSAAEPPTEGVPQMPPGVDPLPPDPDKPDVPAEVAAAEEEEAKAFTDLLVQDANNTYTIPFGPYVNYKVANVPADYLAEFQAIIKDDVEYVRLSAFIDRWLDYQATLPRQHEQEPAPQVVRAMEKRSMTTEGEEDEFNRKYQEKIDAAISEGDLTKTAELRGKLETRKAELRSIEMQRGADFDGAEQRLTRLNEAAEREFSTKKRKAERAEA